MPQDDPHVLGPAPRDPAQKFWDPEMQTMDPPHRRPLQDARVRDLIGKIFERPVPLFRRQLEAAGIGKPDDVAGVDDLAHVPLTTKQDLRESEAATPPWGDYRFTSPSECVRLGQSTGT